MNTPTAILVEWVRDNRVRIFFSTGRVSELELPVKSAKRSKIVHRGLALDPGNGKEMCVEALHRRTDGKIWRTGTCLVSDA